MPISKVELGIAKSKLTEASEAFLESLTPREREILERRMGVPRIIRTPLEGKQFRFRQAALCHFRRHHGRP